jgi:membrane protease YdiL (CAAX protease family)
MEGRMHQSGAQFLEYFGKILILTGMVLVFGSLGVLLSNGLVQLFWGIDLSSINFNEIKESDVQIIAALKLYQTIGGGIGMFLVPALVFPGAIKYQISSMILYRTKLQPNFVALGILSILVAIPAISWMYALNQQMHLPASMNALETSIRLMEQQAEALTKLFVFADSVPVLLLNIFVVALVPAVCEEFFFRGILLQYTRFIFDNQWVAVVVSAIVFSGFHGQFYGFIPRFALGCLLGFLYLHSANIYVPIAAHFVNNAIAVLAVYFEKELSSYLIFQEDYHFTWYWAILSAAASIGIVWYLRNELIQSLYSKLKK